MHNRNEVKWNPFNSLMNGNKIINELASTKSKHSKPVLSEDQLNEISKTLIESFTTKSQINIKYYENGNTYNLKGIINFFDKFNKYIIITNKKIYLNQIININFINF